MFPCRSADKAEQFLAIEDMPALHPAAKKGTKKSVLSASTRTNSGSSINPVVL